MIALPSSQAAEVQCIKPAEAGSVDVKARIVVSGNEAAVQTWLDDASKRGLTAESDRRVSGKREVSIMLPGNTPYRSIGGLIYSGQASGLVITMKTEPPICGAEAE